MPWAAGMTRALLGPYGMAGVLLLLCAFFSLATITDQSPSPEESGRQIAARAVAGGGGGSVSVLVVGRATDEDREFVVAVGKALGAAGVSVVGQVNGEPREAREALEGLAKTGTRVAFIAATAEVASWPVLKNASTRYASLGPLEVIGAGGRRWPTFLTRQNLLNVANQISVVAILAVGMTLVIIAGGIDLSVGSLIALSAVGVTVLIRDRAGGTDAGTMGLLGCSVAGVAACAVIGLMSGALVAIFRVPPFIATLAVMQVASGVAFMIARGGSIYEVPDAFTWLGRGADLLGMPNAVVLTLALYVATHVVMTRTVLGRWVYAVGGNPAAARLAGLNVPLVLLFAYAFCGAMAGLGGVVQASQLKSGAPTYGAMYELYAIAAVVVGGTSLSGGQGKVFGTLIGALIIAVIQNGMNLKNVESYSQKVVLGLVILGAVLLDLLKKRDWRAWSRRFRGEPGAARNARA
jgi:ribose transport system permease protein